MDQIALIIEKLIPLIAVAIGWSLSEFSYIFRSSKEHKQAIAQALSVLLDVRFQIVYLEHMIPVFKKNGIPDEAIPVIRMVFDKVGGEKMGLNEEYEKALEVVAKHAPLIAYEYRSRASFPDFLKNLREIAIENGMSIGSMAQIESKLNSMVIPRMNELVINLASFHSNKLQKEVQKVIEMPFEMPDGFEDYMAEMEQELSNQTSGTSHSSTPS